MVERGGHMNWIIDECTRVAAHDFPLPIEAQQHLSQFGGYPNCNPVGWQDCLRTVDTFLQCPAEVPRDAPNQIISEIQHGHYLPALALTVSWGGMWRTKQKIYSNRNLQEIHDTAENCAQSITQTNSIQQSWELLTSKPPGFQWSSVMTSKALHFLCRALGFNRRPPVPIDRGVIRNRVWPCFRQTIPQGGRPLNWDGDGFDAYCRYMTAIITWAGARHWTTTQMESTIFAEYKDE
jgi:hypothetical protein